MALDAFYELTYDVPEILARFPGTAEPREEIVRKNLSHLEKLVALNAADHEVLRELATNWRLLGTTLFESEKWTEALLAFEKSGEHCATLVNLQPEEALYHRDQSVSHLNAGAILEKLKQHPRARREYELALPSARRASELDPRWSDLYDDLVARLDGSGNR